MAKEDIFQHNIRLNLNNPYHLKIHQALMNVNVDIYGSKNNFMVKKLYEAIYGTTYDPIVDKDYEEKGELFSKEAMEELEKRIIDKVMNEVLRTLLGMVCTSYPHQAVIYPREIKEEKETEDIDDNVADAALGYFEGE